MSCPHSKIGDPSSCSQCLCAPVKRIDQAESEITVDGVRTRPIAVVNEWPIHKKNRERAARRKKRP